MRTILGHWNRKEYGNLGSKPYLEIIRQCISMKVSLCVWRKSRNLHLECSSNTVWKWESGHLFFFSRRSFYRTQVRPMRACPVPWIGTLNCILFCHIVGSSPGICVHIKYRHRSLKIALAELGNPVISIQCTFSSQSTLISDNYSGLKFAHLVFRMSKYC